MNYEFFFLMGIDPKRTLQYLSPYIAEEWHPTLNAPLTPKDVFNNSNKKGWWQCPKNKEHVYDSVINSRTDKNNPRGFPYCGNRKLSPEKSLATLSPDIAEEWHPTLNAPLTPKDVFNSSSKKVWWQCKRNKDHEWQGSINDRTRNDRRRSKGCKICN